MKSCFSLAIALLLFSATLRAEEEFPEEPKAAEETPAEAPAPSEED